jgi:hypothetical protein
MSRSAEEALARAISSVESELIVDNELLCKPRRLDTGALLFVSFNLLRRPRWIDGRLVVLVPRRTRHIYVEARVKGVTRLKGVAGKLVEVDVFGHTFWLHFSSTRVHRDSLYAT